MAFKIAEVFVELKLDKGKYSGKIRSAKRETDGFAKSATKSFKSLKISLIAIAAAATAAILVFRKLARAIIAVGSAVIKAAVDYDKLKIGLKAVAGSAEEAERQLLRLEKVAKLPGLSFRGAIAGSTALQAAGLSAELAERSLLAFGNALVTVGKGAADLQGVNLALTQIVTKGTGFGQELRQLSERLPQVRKAMKEAFGIGSVEDFKKLGLSAEQFIEGIIIEFEKLPKVSGTVANSLENLVISFDRLKAEAGKALLGMTQDSADMLTDILDKLRAIIRNWEAYQDSVAVVLKNIAIIGIETTGVMLKAMAAIISASARLMWEPLKAGLLIALAEGLKESITTVGPLFSLLKRLPGIGDDIEKAWTKAFAPIEKGTDKLQAFLGARGMERFQEAFGPELQNIIQNVNVAIDAFIGGLGKINTELSTIDIQTKTSTSAWQAWSDVIRGFIGDLQKAGQKLLNIPEIARLGPGDKELQAIARFNKLMENTYRKDVENFRSAAEKKADFEKQEREDASEFFEGLAERLRERDEVASKAINAKRVRDNLKTINILLRMEKNRLNSLKRIWDDWTGDIQNVFTNAFADMLDKGKADWSKFASDLKRIFLRNLAELAVSAAFRGLFDLLDRLDRAVLRPSPPLSSYSTGGPIPPDIGAVIFGTETEAEEAPQGSRLAPGVNVIFPNADIEHMSQERIERAVQRQIVPALRKMQKRGLIATRR